jgi:hypothetical protein
MSNEVVTRETKVESCKKSSEDTKIQDELSRPVVNLDCRQRAESNDVINNIDERPITETEWLNSDGYLIRKLHINGNRSKQQSLQPIMPENAIRCSNEVCTSSQIGYNGQHGKEADQITG